MKQNTPKYSIVIPVYNAIKYLPTCVKTVVEQDFDDYELIISDDNSNDGTTQYLESLNHPNIKIVHPEKRLSMVEHFEWAITHATGEWCMYLGGDDGLQLYFFELLEQLTTIANEKDLRVIMSERAYFFWRGCEVLYGKKAVGFNARKQVSILNTKYQSLLALLGFKTYFELPQMYVTSLFKKTLIDEAKSKQGGKLFSTIPPDANLGAIACSLEKRYLKSEIPLGWIGTSPGRLTPTSGNITKEMNDFGIVYEKSCGNFAIGSSSLYFYNAMLRTKNLNTNYFKSILESRLFNKLIFASAYNEVKNSIEIGKEERIHHILVNFHLNKLSNTVSLMVDLLHRIYLFTNRLKRLFYRIIIKKYKYHKDWSEDVDFDLYEVSSEIYKDMKNTNILKVYKKEIK